jgi:hypothetical protein
MKNDTIHEKIPKESLQVATREIMKSKEVKGNRERCQ